MKLFGALFVIGLMWIFYGYGFHGLIWAALVIIFLLALCGDND